MNFRKITISIAMGALAVAAAAQTKSFEIGKSGSAQQQIATVESNADFETFTGRTHKIRGTLKFDPKTQSGSGYIELDISTIDTGIALRNEHMRGEMWLNSAKFQKIRFDTTKIQHIRGDQYRVTGKFTLHGVTRTITTTARVRYLAESEATKKAKFNGDVLHVRTDFSINLSDYGVMIPGPAKGRVANKVKITLSVFASTT